LNDQDTISTEERTILESIAAFVGFHHGKLWSRKEWGNQVITRHALGDEGWKNEQQQLLSAILKAWGTPAVKMVDSSSRWQPWLLGFAGWCTLADWLGSMEEHYPEVSHTDDLTSYIPISREGAEAAWREAGLDMRPSLTAYSFSHIFGNGNDFPPRPLQQTLIDLPLVEPRQPTLTIVEAPTGEGKTEAALYLGARQQHGNDGGIYIAMPSQATSNGLFNRFKDFLVRTHSEEKGGAVNLLLVHGGSSLHPEQERLVKNFLQARGTFSDLYSNDENQKSEQRTAKDQQQARVETASWFLPKKRSLLAPYGIGTVDQTLLSVLYSKHFFLRMFGLAGKTVIFDEVHAYDTYMDKLFCRLLGWLKEMGTDVIILSATLPDVSRRSFINAWFGRKEADVEEAEGSIPPYPAVWHTNESIGLSPSPITFNASKSQRAVIDWSLPDIENVARDVVAAAKKGGTVGVIVNTVNRSQEIYKAIQKIFEEELPSKIDLHLFHARYPFGLRRTIEETVLTRFGKTRPSNRPGILIATQVAEQSLDLDFDLMFSDLAPIDLLLQRAGRLHRHDHHTRTEEFLDPRFVILCSEADEGELPDVNEISGGGHVYEHAALYRTWHLLQNRSEWSLPHDYRSLIEGVYAESVGSPPATLQESGKEEWASAEKASFQKRTSNNNEAQNRLIPLPQNLKSMVTFRQLELADEDEASPELHEHFKAVTRLGDISVSVVCLHQSANGKLWLDPECSNPLPTAPLTRDQIRELQECALNISGFRATWFFDLEDPNWKTIADQTPPLYRHKPLIFRNMEWHDEKENHIEYHTELGIIYHKRTEG
ncbi:MAG: CRISPR-associated helicase Cas3', partial [Candidatus Kapaibacterium sp.]